MSRQWFALKTEVVAAKQLGKIARFRTLPHRAAKNVFSRKRVVARVRTAAGAMSGMSSLLSKKAEVSRVENQEFENRFPQKSGRTDGQIHL